MGVNGVAAQTDAPEINLRRYQDALPQVVTLRRQGRVVQVIGLAIEAEGLNAETGEICEIRINHDRPPVIAEVVGFKQNRALLMPLGEVSGIQPGTSVVATHAPFQVPVGRGLLGRVIDGLGRPIDGLGPLPCRRAALHEHFSPHPLRRPPILQPLQTGVRAIDGFLTVGKGQRVGIFAGSGVGKSTLLGMLARNTKSDVSVIGLIGERGREVREFLERNLGPEGLARSVIVASTSDHPPLVRLKGAWTATTIAESLRDEGLDVTLLMDSVTRLAMAQREVGLAVGEPPAMRAYPPSVFALLPKVLERAGTSELGTITGFYTVLVEGDDLNEPITDTVRSILDGHIVLSRALAGENHYPAIDISSSVSRLMSDLASPEHKVAAGRLREALATYERARDLISIGAYARGTNPEIDRAIDLLPAIKGFLRQGGNEVSPFDETLAGLTRLAN